MKKQMNDWLAAQHEIKDLKLTNKGLKTDLQISEVRFFSMMNGEAWGPQWVASVIRSFCRVRDDSEERERERGGVRLMAAPTSREQRRSCSMKMQVLVIRDECFGRYSSLASCLRTVAPLC